jgi:RNA polymerase sigma-70 factor (ECF subfamily)
MWPDADVTQELVIAAKRGDAQAIGSLLMRHRESIKRLIDLRLDPAVRNRLDASDIVQDVLIEANRRLKDYLADPKLPFHLWLRAMAKDHVIDAHRRHRLAARRSVDREQPLAVRPSAGESTLDLAARLAGREMTPATAATWRELNERFHAACEELDEQDREIIFMRHFEQLSNSDVAAALELSPQAASMRYLRAMRRLRSELDEG